MNFIKESIEPPKLTKFSKVPQVVKVPKVKLTNVVIKKNTSFILNIVLFVLFICFTIFFLLHCKNGIFQSINKEPMPFNN